MALSLSWARAAAIASSRLATARSNSLAVDAVRAAVRAVTTTDAACVVDSVIATTLLRSSAGS